MAARTAQTAKLRNAMFATAILAHAIAAHMRFLANDLLEGRGPASRGGELAMRYIASQYERIGLQPAGDKGGWLQGFDILGLKSDVVTPMTFVGAVRAVAHEEGEHARGVARGVQRAHLQRAELERLPRLDRAVARARSRASLL